MSFNGLYLLRFSFDDINLKIVFYFSIYKKNVIEMSNFPIKMYSNLTQIVFEKPRLHYIFAIHFLSVVWFEYYLLLCREVMYKLSEKKKFYCISFYIDQHKYIQVWYEHTILPNFPKNYMKSKEFGRPGGAPLAPPISATGMTWMLGNWISM